jgi:uncharacterized membrane protein HdeD (DUF308 family)
MVLTVLLVRPLIIDSIWGSGAERAKQVGAELANYSFTQRAQLMTQSFFAHLHPNYMFFGETTSLRHGDGQWGVLYGVEGVLILVSIGLFIWSVKKKTQFSISILGVAWIVAGLLPTALSLDVPHSNRALLALPGFLLLVLAAFDWLLQQVDWKHWWQNVETKQSSTQVVYKSLVGVIVLTYFFSVSSFLSDYFRNYPAISSAAYFYGYQQVFEKILQLEEQRDKILFTSEYGQPYIYALFFRQTNPIWYQGGSLIKYEFTNTISEADLNRHKTIIVATPQQIDPGKADELVIGPDGQVRFVIVDTGK